MTERGSIPTLRLETSWLAVRAEAALQELPPTLRPPISRRPLPARLEMAGSRRRSRNGGLVVSALLAIAAVTALLFPYHLFPGSGTAENGASREGNKVAAAGKDRTGNGASAATRGRDRVAGGRRRFGSSFRGPGDTIRGHHAVYSQAEAAGGRCSRT